GGTSAAAVARNIDRRVTASLAVGKTLREGGLTQQAELYEQYLPGVLAAMKAHVLGPDVAGAAPPAAGPAAGAAPAAPPAAPPPPARPAGPPPPPPAPEAPAPAPAGPAPKVPAGLGKMNRAQLFDEAEKLEMDRAGYEKLKVKELRQAIRDEVARRASALAPP